MDTLIISLMVFGPAAIGLGALAWGIALLTRSSDFREDGQHSTNHARVVGGVLLLLVALGIGSCYAMMTTL